MARGHIRTSPAPVPRVLMAAPLISRPDNASLQLPLLCPPASPSPALPSPRPEAGGCRGEQGVGLGLEGKQSPLATMERVVRGPLGPS